MRPDIFPFTDEAKTTQSRPFGGDAKNRCANAKAAGLRTGKTPSVGALVVYSNAISSAGHVGQVIGIPGD
ncbi:TPA: hypothetical protein DCZ39_01540 [Patescibacteria group bacterium]|nr:hypothetical protein [Candidatus Gracilibacteria bacterium]